MALVGAATAFVESTLGQLFKQHATDSFVGGPAYYISRGMRYCSWKPLRGSGRWMSVLFAILITVTFGLANNSIQANTICGAMNQAFGLSPVVMGGVLAALTLLIVFGGIQRIAHVSAILVPVMAVGYFLLAVFIVVTNITVVPHVLKIIVEDAFGLSQVVGGGIGAAMMNGVKRGLFSNEAGEGSAPNAASTADVTHPVKQGLIQALGVFTDTLLVCSCTAFIILISGLYQSSGLNGINLTQVALESEIGSSGPVFVAVAIFLFAFSSIIANYYYGEANIRFMTSSRRVMTIYRVCSGGVMVMIGALVTLEVAWNMIDFCMAMLTACNLVAIMALGKYAFRLLDDYRRQKREGIREPQFHRHQLPEIADSLECWD
jgi:AGCS family alanine or glycine:cation symporter